MLLKEFAQVNPDATIQEKQAFYVGMTWLEDALANEEETESRLNDELPLRISHEYLRKQLIQVVSIIAENDKLKDKLSHVQNELDNIKNLSKSEFSALRKTEEYNRLFNENESLKKVRDLLICELNRLYKESNKSKSDKQ